MWKPPINKLKLGNEEKESCPESKRLLLKALGRHSVLTGITQEPSVSTGSGRQGQGGVELGQSWYSAWASLTWKMRSKVWS